MRYRPDKVSCFENHALSLFALRSFAQHTRLKNPAVNVSSGTRVKPRPLNDKICLQFAEVKAQNTRSELRNDSHAAKNVHQRMQGSQAGNFRRGRVAAAALAGSPLLHVGLQIN